VPFTALVTKSAVPSRGIIEAAQRRKCDVIFMASHGHRGLTGLLLGSVTQEVLTHSEIPVLVFR
jgi:nucleotide-binding universal stress UspA family protein